VLAAVLASAAGVLAGCSGGGAAGAAANSIIVGTTLASSQVLSRALQDTPRSLDPELATDVPSQEVLDDLFEGLTAVDIAGQPSPGVASSWHSSADGLTWTFHLRPDARWSNGAAITAQDFVYSWRREVDPRTGAAYAQALAPIRNAMQIASGKMPADTLGVEALDAHTLRVQLNSPTPYLLALLTEPYLYPVYQPAIERYGDNWVLPQHLVSNGAFMLRENIIGNRITLDKNPYYWDAAHVHLQRVIDYILRDQANQVQRFLAGNVAWTDMFPSSEFGYLRSKLGDQVVTSTYFGTYIIGMNFQRPPFKDNRALRLALDMAIDREPLTHYLRQGLNRPAYTLMPPLPGYQLPLPDWAKLPDDQRHARAQALYRQAGYSRSHPLHVELDVPVEGADARELFEALAANWRSVLGADVQLREIEFKVLVTEKEQHNYELYHDSWIGDYPDPYTFMELFLTGDGNNSGAYSNPQFDQLVERARQTADIPERYRLFEQAERMLDEDAAYIPYMYYSTEHLVKPYLRGWQSNILDRNLSRYMYLLAHQGS
jgi:oligopeptide transport system substrate-binding protein